MIFERSRLGFTVRVRIRFKAYGSVFSCDGLNKVKGLENAQCRWRTTTGMKENNNHLFIQQ